MERVGKWARALVSEMESAALFVVSAVLHARAGAVYSCACGIKTNRFPYKRQVRPRYGLAIKTAIEAVRILIKREKNCGGDVLSVYFLTMNSQTNKSDKRDNMFETSLFGFQKRRRFLPS